jgi:hypothetical protein
MRKLVLAFFSLMLAGCATTIPTNKYSDVEREKLLQFSGNPNVARVFFLNGITSNQMVNLRHGFPSSLILNDVVIGSVNKGDVLVADLKPGNYVARWRPPFEKDGASRFKAQNLNLQAGEVVIIRSIFNPGGTGFGLIGAALSPPSLELDIGDDKSDISSLTVVKPTDCPQTLCVTP